MNWWKRFLRARKQRDSIKLMLLLAAGALGFFAGTIYRGVVLYRMVNSPVEYVLYGEQNRTSELAELPEVVAVSPQMERSHIFVYQGQEHQVSCVELSEEYLNEVYGIQTQGVTETFYMNRPALRRFQTADSELLVTCLTEEIGGNDTQQSFQTTAKLRLAEGIREQEKPLILVKKKNSGQQALSVNGAKSGQVRIFFKRQDLDGTQQKEVESLGFSIENQELLIESKYQKSELLLRMKYEALIGILLAVGAVGTWKYGKN